MNLISILLGFVVFAADAFNVKKRITGGLEVQHGSSKHHASVLVNSVYTCGGSIISRFHVLTAAHCLDEVIALGLFRKVVAVLVGSVLINHGKFHAVKRISHHKNFSRRQPYLFRDDIGMVHVSNPIEFSEGVAMIALPGCKFNIMEKTDLAVTGYGNRNRGDPFSQRLSKLIVTTEAFHLCQNRLQNYILKASILCSILRRGLGCTQGDEGSGLTDIEQQILLGIASVTQNGYHGNKPDIFTQVSHYLDYIYEEATYGQLNSTGLNTNPALNYDISVRAIRALA